MPTDLERVTEVCTRLGASPAQAATMAAQLLKRADQLATERGVSRVEALAQLLQLVVKGRSGEPADLPPAPKPRSESG